MSDALTPLFSASFFEIKQEIKTLSLLTDKRTKKRLSIWSDSEKHNSFIDFGSRSTSSAKKFISPKLLIFFNICFLLSWALILFWCSISFFNSLSAFWFATFSCEAFFFSISFRIISWLDVAVILLIPNAWEPSEIILNVFNSLVFLTCVPPHNS